MVFFHALVLLLSASSPLLDVTDTINRGGTAVYTVSLEKDTVYWIILQSTEGVTDLNISASSSGMDFEQFMSLPYRDDFYYALEFAVASGLEPGDESITLTADYSGPFYVVVNDAGGNGGEFVLKIQ
jgi:hypothetical protein